MSKFFFKAEESLFQRDFNGGLKVVASTLKGGVRECFYFEDNFSCSHVHILVSSFTEFLYR
jgi:hypothetical protein